MVQLYIPKAATSISPSQEEHGVRSGSGNTDVAVGCVPLAVDAVSV